MIDFENAKFFKLHQTDNDSFYKHIAPMFVPGEEVVSAFKGVRDGIVFTNKRLISINIQGMTGKKKDFTSLPYSRIQAYSVETSGVFDMESELILWFSGMGKIYFEFARNANVTEICRIISGFVLR